MPKRNSNVKIVEGKVLLSDEVLNIIESWRTEENSEWVDKYLEIISDPSNIDSKKSRGHHIIPCFVFKDEEHKNRKETEPLADEIKGNKIKLSIANHMICHYYLWKIIKNEDSRRAVYMSFNKKNINYLSENEIKKFARIQEECSKENQTEEDRRELSKKRYEEHKEEKSEYRKEHKNEKSEYDKNYYQINKNKKSEYDKIYRKEHRKEKLKKAKERYECKKDELKQKSKDYYYKNREQILKENAEHAEERRECNKKYRNQECYDSVKENYCTLGALKMRKERNKDLYKDIIPQNCIIKKKK